MTSTLPCATIKDVTAEEQRNIRRQVLPNGLLVLTEHMPHIRSVSIGIWLKTGSRHEDAAANGISHFLEHMVFKGTRTRTAEDIARQIDSLGGNMDAFTAKECTCFNAKVLDEHLPVALDILSDLVLNPIFDENDITRERGVILEEIKLDEDSPDYLVHEIFTQNFWKGHSLGLPILGTRQTVRRFNRDLVLDSYAHRFLPGNLIVSAAGSLDHERFVDLVAQKFQHLPAGRNGYHDSVPAVSTAITLSQKKLEQAQICLGVPAHPIAHHSRYANYLLNLILGGGMSSRLFQNIRERQGLAYAIYSDLDVYRDTGCLSVYAGTSPETASRVVDCIMDEFRALKNKPVTEDELNRAKGQLKGSLMLSLESSNARMSNLARQEMYFDRFVGLDEITERIESVTVQDLAALANEYFQTGRVSATVLGDLNGLTLPPEQLAC